MKMNFLKYGLNFIELIHLEIEQTKALLNKENLTINDFYGVNGYGEIVHYLDEKGRKNWDLINVNICGVNELRTCKYDDEDNKKIIDKISDFYLLFLYCNYIIPWLIIASATF